MIPHPKTMQAVTDQRWQELRVRADRERLAITAREQTPAATPIAKLQVRIAGAVPTLSPILGRQEPSGSGDARRPAVP